MLINRGRSILSKFDPDGDAGGMRGELLRDSGGDARPPEMEKNV